MSYAGSGGDDQSEDGELRHSPSETKPKDDILDFRLDSTFDVSKLTTNNKNLQLISSLSKEDQDTADSLDIKPPQAARVTVSRSKRRERAREGRSRHGRSERHREERLHSHREKRHREHREAHREVYRDYKEMYVKSEGYRDVRYDPNVYKEVYRGESRREHEGSSREVRIGYESRSEKRMKDMERHSEKEWRYMQVRFC